MAGVNLPIPELAEERIRETVPTLFYEKLHELATPPQRAHDTDVGYDLFACLPSESGHVNFFDLPPNLARKVPTKLIVWANGDHYLEVHSRSGLAAGKSVFVANGPGIIDPGYRGEVHVILINCSRQVHRLKHGDRIAQLIIRKAIRFPVVETTHLSKEETDRGVAGYGSTGQ